MSSGSDFFDKCHADAQRMLNSYAETVWKTTSTRTEVRDDAGRSYTVEVDKKTGMTAEEAKAAAQVELFLSKGGVVTYTRDSNGFRVSVHQYSRMRCDTIHGLGIDKISLTKATQAAVFEFFVHRANIKRRFKEQCGQDYVDEFTEQSGG